MGKLGFFPGGKAAGAGADLVPTLRMFPLPYILSQTDALWWAG